MHKIKVLIVEDSLVFRNVLVQGLNRDPMIEIVAQVQDPYEASEAILKYRPDVMTLDIELPKMNGIEFLRRLMPQYPLPVIVISSLSDKVFDAMHAGAVDFVRKPSGMNRDSVLEFIRQELVTKVKIASKVKVSELQGLRVSPVPSQGGPIEDNRIIAIGASTGGPEAISSVLKEFQTDIPGVVVVQHMPPGFTSMYAERLNRQCRVRVKEAKNGEPVVRGQVLLAPGDKQMRLIKVGKAYHVECKSGEKVSGHCPSVDVLFESVAQSAGKDSIGILLTGMGGDGAKGLLQMRKNGAITIGQDEASSVIYGMPKVAYDIGAVEYQLGLEYIPGKVYGLLRRGKE